MSGKKKTKNITKQQYQPEQKRNEEKTKIFTFSNIISVLALIVAFLSFVYPVFREQWEHWEYLTFQTTNLRESYNTHISKYGTNDDLAGFYTEMFDITISNHSDKDTSIIDLKTRLMLTNEGDMYNCLSKRFELPINMKAHESKKVQVELRFPLNKKAYNAIVEKYGEKVDLPFDILREEIHNLQIDMFGNEIIFNKEYPYIITYKNEDEKKIPVAELLMNTSENNTFLCEIVPSK